MTNALKNLRGYPSLPSVTIQSIDCRGMDVATADVAIRKTLTKLDLHTPCKHDLPEGIANTSYQDRLPSDYLLKSFTDCGDVIWMGIYRRMVVEPHPQLGGHPVRRMRTKVLYSSTLEGVVDAIAEHNLQFEAA